MKKLLIYIGIFIALIGCSTTKPMQEVVTIHQIDSIVWHDSIIYVEVPKEVYKDVIPIYDTLLLETSLARATAFCDTNTHTIKGSIENKDTTLSTKIKWKERIQYKDTTIIKEIPVEVETIKYKYPISYWIFLGIVVLLVIFIVVKIYIKLKI